MVLGIQILRERVGIVWITGDSEIRLMLVDVKEQVLPHNVRGTECDIAIGVNQNLCWFTVRDNDSVGGRCFFNVLDRFFRIAVEMNPFTVSKFTSDLLMRKYLLTLFHTFSLTVPLARNITPSTFYGIFWIIPAPFYPTRDILLIGRNCVKVGM